MDCKYRYFSFLYVSAIWLITSPVLDASEITLLVSRASILNPDPVNWDQLGPAGSEILQPFEAASEGGIKLTVLKNNSGTPFHRVDQGFGFSGDFSPGEHLLYSTSLTAFDFRFERPIQAIGAQIQIDRFGTWTPYVRVFTTDGDDKAFVLSEDMNNQLADGSAVFVGVASDKLSINRVLFDSFYGGNTAMNYLTVAIPEPNSFMCLAIVIGIAVQRLRRLRSAKVNELCVPENLD